MAQRFKIDAVEHNTSNATHVSQNCAPNIQYPNNTIILLFLIGFNSKSFLPNISFTPANVITNDATNKSAIAKDAKNKFPILRKLRSV